jgi:hypothetical protein
VLACFIKVLEHIIGNMRIFTYIPPSGHKSHVLSGRTRSPSIESVQTLAHALDSRNF